MLTVHFTFKRERQFSVFRCQLLVTHLKYCCLFALFASLLPNTQIERERVKNCDWISVVGTCSHVKWVLFTVRIKWHKRLMPNNMVSNFMESTRKINQLHNENAYIYMWLSCVWVWHIQCVVLQAAFTDEYNMNEFKFLTSKPTMNCATYFNNSPTTIHTNDNTIIRQLKWEPFRFGHCMIFVSDVLRILSRNEHTIEHFKRLFRLIKCIIEFGLRRCLLTCPFSSYCGNINVKMSNPVGISFGWIKSSCSTTHRMLIDVFLVRTGIDNLNEENRK